MRFFSNLGLTLTVGMSIIGNGFASPVAYYIGNDEDYNSPADSNNSDHPATLKLASSSPTGPLSYSGASPDFMAIRKPNSENNSNHEVPLYILKQPFDKTLVHKTGNAASSREESPVDAPFYDPVTKKYYLVIHRDHCGAFEVCSYDENTTDNQLGHKEKSMEYRVVYYERSPQDKYVAVVGSANQELSSINVARIKSDGSVGSFEQVLKSGNVILDKNGKFIGKVDLGDTGTQSKLTWTNENTLLVGSGKGDLLEIPVENNYNLQKTFEATGSYSGNRSATLLLKYGDILPGTDIAYKPTKGQIPDIQYVYKSGVLVSKRLVWNNNDDGIKTVMIAAFNPKSNQFTKVTSLINDSDHLRPMDNSQFGEFSLYDRVNFKLHTIDLDSYKPEDDVLLFAGRDKSSKARILYYELGKEFDPSKDPTLVASNK